MAEKIDPIKYAENLMSAWKEDDLLAVEKIEETHGDQEVTLKDVESLFAYVMQVLSTAYAGQDALYQDRFDTLLELLLAKKVIDSEELEAIKTDDKELQEVIDGTREIDVEDEEGKDN